MGSADRQQQLLRSLRANRGNRTATARELGVSRTTLYKWIKRLPAARVPPPCRNRARRKPAAAISERDRLATAHFGEAKRLARFYARGLPGWVRDLADFEGAASEALLKAADRYDPARGIVFSTYLAPRIRGAVLDELRKWDHVTRSRRQEASKREATEARLGQELGHPPSDEQLCRELDWTMTQLGRSRLPKLSSPPRQDAVVKTDSPSPVRQSANLELFERLIRGVGIQAKVVLFLYLQRPLTLKQIGEILGLSERRISQIRSDALNYLKKVRDPDEVYDDYRAARV